MQINLWAKKGKVIIALVENTNPNTAPTLTMELKDPQIVYDDTTSKITIVESK